jgi:hypothetical protein
MARQFKSQNSFSNVSAGSTATLQLPLGATYDSLHVKYSGVTLAQLKNIEVRINGKVIQSFIDGNRLQDINKHYKRNIKSGVLTIWFVRPEMDNVSLRRMTAIGTADVATFDLRVDIDAAATAPVLTAFAIKSNQSALGMITKIKRFPASSATSGLKEIDNIPREGRIAAVHLFKSDISKAEVEVNERPVYDFDKALGAGVQVDHGRNPNSSKHTSVDFTLEGDPSQALVVQGANDFRIRTTLDTSGAFDIVVEYLTAFDGI